MSQDDVQSAPKVIKKVIKEKKVIKDDEWVSFPGGELEGQHPKVLCLVCRDAVHRAAAEPGATNLLRGARRGLAVKSRGTRGGGPRVASGRQPARTFCFQCYRANLDRNRALRAAGQLHTASDEHFQSQLPFEPVNTPRLEMLKAERSQARVIGARGAGRFVEQRREAQIAARHALHIIAAGCKGRQPAVLRPYDRDRAMGAAIHAAELQFPESWLPFVVAQ
jgi:hypothetical protein